jgi:hypothetical protein
MRGLVSLVSFEKNISVGAVGNWVSIGFPRDRASNTCTVAHWLKDTHLESTRNLGEARRTATDSQPTLLIVAKDKVKMPPQTAQYEIIFVPLVVVTPEES